MDENGVLVARDRELARLDAFLDMAMAGHGQVCLVEGRAGMGKTALANEFVRRAQEKHADLIVSVGMCDAQTGVVNPYFPFREVLNLLLGDFDTKLAQGRISSENARRLGSMLTKTVEILLETGPDLIGLLIPGGTVLAKLALTFRSLGKTSAVKAGLLPKLDEVIAKKSAQDVTGHSSLDQSQVYEQCTNVLCSIAAYQPLLVVLDDLHWADSASIGLLFRLGRRLEAHRVMMLGTYRPDEVPKGISDDQRNPLAKVLAEFRRYLGDIWIDLDRVSEETGREFIDAYLDSMPNRLDQAFREALYEHTHGEPLFTVELVSELGDRGDLVQSEDGYWELGATLTWDEMPPRVEGVVAERIARLSDEVRDYLKVGSAEGDQFTAESVAQVRGVEVRTLIRQISGEAQNTHHLVQAAGVERVAGRRLSHYRFTSKSIRAYLEAILDEIERSYLHEDVGLALEALYGEESERIAVELARHFELADLPGKACHYLRIAGEQAAAGSAHDQAVFFFSRALALTPADDAYARFPLLLAREDAYGFLGVRDAQRRDLENLQRVVVGFDDPLSRAEVALRAATFALQVGHYADALAHAERSAVYAVQAGDPIAEANAHIRWGRVYWQIGPYPSALVHLEQALALARASQNVAVEAQCLYDLAVTAHYLNDLKGAWAHVQQASGTFVALEDRKSEHLCLSLCGVIKDAQGDLVEAMSYYARALELARKVGYRYGEARTLNQSGDTLLRLGAYAESQPRLEMCLQLCREVEDRATAASTMDMLGLVAYFQGQYEVAGQWFDQALAAYREMNERRGLGYVLTHLGFARTDQQKWEEAGALLHEAWALRRADEDWVATADTLAGLTRLALALGAYEDASAYAEEVVDVIDQHGITGVEYPILAFHACYEAFSSRALADPEFSERATKMLERGHNILLEHAVLINGESARARFLHDVPYNRALHEAWLARQPAD